MEGEKGEQIETLILPVEVIQHIQSYMSGKEAVRSALLSKSWHNAWLTCPTVDLNDVEFNPHKFGEFEKFSKKTMQRYRDSNLKIERFRLHVRGKQFSSESTPIKLIIAAMKTGATDLKLDYLSWPVPFTLPQEVLGSKTLLRLAASSCEIDVKNVIRCSRLKSLSLDRATMGNGERFMDIITSCSDSLEELSLTYCAGLTLNLIELRKLRRLYLDSVGVDALFFTDFGSRFPYLRDLTILQCFGYTTILIASDSLQTIRFRPLRNRESYSWDSNSRAKFDVPNIQKLAYLGFGVPSELIVNGASKECEFELTMDLSCLYTSCWFLKLKRFLTKFRSSRISLFIPVRDDISRCLSLEIKVGNVEVEAEPILVENLEIGGHSTICCALLRRLFGICRPKFIDHGWDESIDALCQGLMQKLITPNSGIPNQHKFGQFGLKRVNMELYRRFGAEWLPLDVRDVRGTPGDERRVRFELIWD